MKSIIIIILHIICIVCPLCISCNKNVYEHTNTTDNGIVNNTDNQAVIKTEKYLTASALKSAIESEKVQYTVDWEKTVIEVAEMIERDISEENSVYELQSFSYLLWEKYEDYTTLRETKDFFITLTDTDTEQNIPVVLRYKYPKDYNEESEKINDKLYRKTQNLSDGKVQQEYYYVINDDYQFGFYVLNYSDGKLNTEFNKIMSLISEIDQIVIRNS